MYRLGKVIKSGTATDSGVSNLPAAATAYVLDMNQPAPAWRQIASMAFPRAYQNTTLLPDGNVLVTGGERRTDGADTSQAVYEAELWSPVTETWQTMAPSQVPRLYHSTALLLPDARVLVAGGGNDGAMVNQLQSEIYSPPYLFKGPRPTITSAPQVVQYGSNFVVQTPDAANIASMALMRLGAVTHSFDEEQRFLNLTFQQGVGSLTVQAPASANQAPPGFYLLFIVNTSGIPSVAPFVRLASTPTVISTSPASGASGISTGTNVAATFSEAMDASTINSNTFELRDPANTLVAATVTYDSASKTATLDPTPTLTAPTTYTATIKGGATDPRVKDVAGNALAANYTWSFTTGTSALGQWSAPFNLGLVAVNMVLMRTGKVLMYSGQDIGGTSASVWDPATGTVTPVPNNQTNIFCSGHSALADGRILVVGGHDTANSILGSADANIFDPATQLWTSLPKMAYRRWYPTATTLGDGRVLVTARDARQVRLRQGQQRRPVEAARHRDGARARPVQDRRGQGAIPGREELKHRR